MLHTESAYFSDHGAHRVPNYNNSFTHSIIQTHIPQKIETNKSRPPIFSMTNEEQKTYINQVIDEENYV
jgi:hypothetical protein